MFELAQINTLLGKGGNTSQKFSIECLDLEKIKAINEDYGEMQSVSFDEIISSLKDQLKELQDKEEDFNQNA